MKEFVATIREWRGHKRTEPVTMGVVNPLDAIIEDLKLLPPEKVSMIADFIGRLKGTSEDERQAALARTAGCLSPEEADAMEDAIEDAIEDGCERIDEDGWRPIL